MAEPDDLSARLRAGDLSVAPAVLNLVESRTPEHRAQAAALLERVSPAALGREPDAHVVGVTGAPATRAAAAALATAFDVVVIETVGVGQSETEVADVADSVAVVVQPGSGDVLQFLKSGIMEIPDVLVVTKADLGKIANRARADLRAALRSLGTTDTDVLAVSSL